MADAKLQHSLDRAFDPGPDFPHPLLLSRTMSALEADVAGHGRDDRSRASEWRGRPAWLVVPRAGGTLVAVGLIVALALAAIGVVFAASEYARRSVPVQTHPASTSCSQGNLHMVSAAIGWNGTSLTTDGGVTWKDVSPPQLPNASKGGRSLCVLDPTHAWVTEATGLSDTGSPGQLFVFSTRDAGITWQLSPPLLVYGPSPGVQLDFIDAVHGWLLDDSRLYSGDVVLYSTSDGGLDWTEIARGPVWLPGGPSLANGNPNLCTPSGMTFRSLSTGWLVYDCISQSFPSYGPDPQVETTTDGGRHWTWISAIGADIHTSLALLPAYATNPEWSCAGSPPVFSLDQGVLPVHCIQHVVNSAGKVLDLPTGAAWSAAFTTTNGGATWAAKALPFPAELSAIDFVDANIGFAFAPEATGNDLYRTTDAGRDWALVTTGLFIGQAVDGYQFIDATRGFAFTDSSLQAPWRTTDGGLTWSLPSPYKTLPGNVACDTPSNPGAGGAPVPVMMASPTTGWAVGARRTTDGGSHWSNVGPPTVPDRSSGYEEFFLDATHAWVAETAGSATACADHIVVFRTSDGGKTWGRADAIPVQVAQPSDVIWNGGVISSSPTTPTIRGGGPGSWLDFVDANDGWLMVETWRGFAYSPQVGPLYRTTDGGVHWTIVSASPGSSKPGCINDGAISFSSPSTGWTVACIADFPLQTMATHDGGMTWRPQAFSPGCGCDGNVPVFFDEKHGLLVTWDRSRHYSVVVTADGGITWSSPRALPTTGIAQDLEFVDSTHGWAIEGETATGFQLEQTTDGGMTWSVVNSSLPSIGPDGFLALTFADPTQGFLATGSALFRTNDGGRTWTVLPT